MSFNDVCNSPLEAIKKQVFTLDENFVLTKHQRAQQSGKASKVKFKRSEIYIDGKLCVLLMLLDVSSGAPA